MAYSKKSNKSKFSKNTRNRNTTSSKTRSKTMSEKTMERYPDEEENMRNPKTPGRNDSSWYAASEQLLRDAASVPYAWMTGVPFSLGDTIGRTPSHPDGDGMIYGGMMIPGICTLEIVPTLGHSDDVTSAANTAATSIYSYVRYMNSGATNYEATDLMLYLISMAEVYSAINWAQRLYGMVTLYSQENRYMPRVLMEAEGVDFDSFMNNMANYRTALNILINKAASMAVPNVMDIFQRYAFLYRDVYIEGPSIKDQMYMYVPKGWHIFHPTQDANPGSLVYTARPKGLTSSNRASWSDVINYLNSMIEPIIVDEDMNIMSGDIKKAYGDNLIKLSELGESYRIMPVYNVEVLEQMHNATVTKIDETTLSITQAVYSTGGDTRSYLVSNPQVRWGSIEIGDQALNYLAFSKLLTTNLPDPTPRDTMVNTRLMTVTTEPIKAADFDSSAKVSITSGSDICVEARIWRVAPLNPGSPQHYDFGDFTYGPNTNTSPNQLVNSEAMNIIATIGQFHYAPLLPMFGFGNIRTAVDGTNGFLGFLGDIDNYAVIDRNMLTKMHDVALLNLMNVPIAEVARA